MLRNKDFHVDAVITWVNGNDPKHKTKMQHYLDNKNIINNKSLRMRFDQVNEIEFAVKSILKYAKFVRNIFIVTDNQTPDFLKDKASASKNYPTVSIIDHKIIFKGYEEYLPTFNSLAIETMLYRIPGLADQFIYFNDDVFLANETQVEDFFKNQKPILRGKWNLFYEHIWHKKLKLFFKKITKKQKQSNYKHNKGLQKPAEFLNFKKYFFTPHIPATFLKPSLETFFENNKSILIDNIKSKFREPGQFVAHSLSNHLQIKSENYVHQKDNQLVYFQNYTKPLWWLRYKLSKVENNKNILFLCMQSLDQCPEDKLQFIKTWLHNKYD
jgi:hypothetical protein|tara:strand:+ start:500 stop:1480 length:981 start_codon:yes stop_codon:yes gene_type:complete